jgi:hypothetical protein
MIDHDAPGGGPMTSRSSRRRRLRITGATLFAVGIAAALLTYWIETRGIDPMAEQVGAAAAAADARQMAILYGPTGALVLGWVAALERPEAQAGLIMLASVVAAGLCFRVAHLAED